MTEKSTFQNTCVRNLKKLPKTPCSKAVFKEGKEPACPWWIVSERHCDCFWVLNHSRSNSESELPQTNNTELAKIMGWTNSKAQQETSIAMEELKKVMEGREDELRG